MPTIPWTAPRSAQPGDGSVTVMASRLELRRLADVPAFLVAALRIRRQMLAAPGALGVSLVAKGLRRTFWTLSAWRDEAALSAAFKAEPHRHLIEHFKPRMAGSRFVTWTTPGSALPIPWAEALRRLEKPDMIHRQA